MRIRALVVDDEPEARAFVRGALERDPDVSIVGERADGFEAAAAFLELRPDLVFLDVEMPGLDGFGAVAAVEPADLPYVVFVTAHEEFALRAFEVHALDYIVKPFEKERVLRALDRARKRIQGRRFAEVEQGVAALLARIRSERGGPEWLLSQEGRRSVFVRVEEVDWIRADGNRVVLHAGRAEHVHRATLQALEGRLAPDRFARIHRSTIVNLSRIARVDVGPDGAYAVVLADETRLPMGDSYRHRVRELRAVEV